MSSHVVRASPPTAALNGSLQSARAVQWQRGSAMGAPYWLPAWSIRGWLIGLRPHFARRRKTKHRPRAQNTHSAFSVSSVRLEIHQNREDLTETLFTFLWHTHTHTGPHITDLITHSLTLWLNFPPPQKNPRTTTHVQNFSFFPLRRVVKLSLSLHYEPFTPASTLLCRKIVKVWSNIDEL